MDWSSSLWDHNEPFCSVAAWFCYSNVVFEGTMLPLKIQPSNKFYYVPHPQQNLWQVCWPLPGLSSYRTHSQPWFSSKPETWLQKASKRNVTSVPSAVSSTGTPSPHPGDFSELGLVRDAHERWELSDPAQPSRTSVGGSGEYPGAAIVAEQLRATREESWEGHKQGRNAAGSERPELLFCAAAPSICR